jgi:hypothetical protein
MCVRYAHLAAYELCTDPVSETFSIYLEYRTKEKYRHKVKNAVCWDDMPCGSC